MDTVIRVGDDMLTEDEIKQEILLIQRKIDSYRKELEPFQELEKLFDEKANRVGSSIDVKITISQKASKEAMIKAWEKEIIVYNRVLEGKKMDPLPDPRYYDGVADKVKRIVKEIKEDKS